MRVFYGKASDPHLKWAAEMTHGINTNPSSTSKELVNPDPNSLFQQRTVDRREKIYASHIRAPLGISHDQGPGLPRGLDKEEFIFGIPTELGWFQYVYTFSNPLDKNQAHLPYWCEGIICMGGTSQEYLGNTHFV